MEIIHTVEEQISASKENGLSCVVNLTQEKGHLNTRIHLKILNYSSNPLQEKLLSNIFSMDGEYARTNKEAANMLAKQYEKASKLKCTAEDRSQCKSYKTAIRNIRKVTQDCIFITDLTFEELESAIHCLDPKKFLGPDVIFGQMINHFGENAKRFLLEILNISCQLYFLSFCYRRTCCKNVLSLSLHI